MDHYINVWKKYAVFEGRASRAEYWYFVLFNYIAAFSFGFIVALLGFAEGTEQLYSLAVFIPSIAVSVRRMHDVNKSGWHLIIPFYNFILAIREGTDGPNDYGDVPLVKEKEETI